MTTPPRTRPQRTGSRRGPIIIAVVIALVVAGWTVAWFVAANYAERIIDDTIAAQTAQGTRIACSDRSISGWPFRLSLTCAPLTIERADGTRLMLPAVRAVSLIYRPTHLIIEADAPASLNPFARAPDGTATWDLGHASLVFSPTGPRELAVSFTGLALSGFAPIGLKDGLTARLAEIHTRRDPDDPSRIDAALTLKGFTRPGDTAPIDARILVTVPDPMSVTETRPLNLAAASAATPAAIALANGGISIREITINDETTRLSLAGDLKPDALSRPSGTLMLTVANPDGLQSLLARLLPPSSSLAATIAGAVSGFGKTTGEGEDRTVEVPVNVSGGAVSLGLIPLGRLPTL